MFIVCKDCDGSGEGVYGHSWTTCPVCNGAGQIVVEIQPVPYFEAPVMPKAGIKATVCPEAKSPIRCGRNSVVASRSAIDPTGVFPEEKYLEKTAA